MFLLETITQNLMFERPHKWTLIHDIDTRRPFVRFTADQPVVIII